MMQNRTYIWSQSTQGSNGIFNNFISNFRTKFSGTFDEIYYFTQCASHTLFFIHIIGLACFTQHIITTGVRSTMWSYILSLSVHIRWGGGKGPYPSSNTSIRDTQWLVWGSFQRGTPVTGPRSLPEGTLEQGYPPARTGYPTPARTGIRPGQDWNTPPGKTGVPRTKTWVPPEQVTLGQFTPRAVRLLWFPHKRTFLFLHNSKEKCSTLL